LECFNPSILKTEPLPVTSAQSSWLQSSPLKASIRAAFSRGSGFVPWHLPAVSHLSNQVRFQE